MEDQEPKYYMGDDQLLDRRPVAEKTSEESAPVTPVLSEEQLSLKASLTSLHGPLNEVAGVVRGQNVVCFLKKMPYSVRKAATLAFMAHIKDEDKPIDELARMLAVGEVILSGCYVGGYNLFADEDTRLDACLAAASLLEAGNLFHVKKN